jgi:hypothetical protein
MLKRALMIGFAVGAALAILHATTAEAGAGWIYARPPGTWVWGGSVNLCNITEKIRNPENFPMQMRCVAESISLEYRCDNPGANTVFGEVATGVVLVELNKFDEGDLLLNDKEQKVKNAATLCVAFDDTCPDSPLCSDDYCRNVPGQGASLNGWENTAVQVVEARLNCQNEQCTGEDDPDTLEDETCDSFVVTDTQECQCFLPNGWGVDNKPECDNDLGIGCVQFECYRVVDGMVTNELCGVPPEE